MKCIWFILILLLVSAIPRLSTAGLFGPSDYDECILQSMKGVTSDKAAILIARSCREKFPEKIKKSLDSRPLSSEELGRLSGRAGAGFSNYFNVNLYNGNTNITVSEIWITVTTEIGGKEESRLYTKEVLISPQSTKDFSFLIIQGDAKATYSWGIYSARGF